jgi:hypothetical protein
MLSNSNHSKKDDTSAKRNGNFTVCYKKQGLLKYELPLRKRLKNTLTITALLFACIFLYACPYSSPYKIDDAPGIYVEDELIGNWATFIQKPQTGKSEPVKCILTKKTDTEYGIAFTGSINELKKFRLVDKDSISGTAYMSTVAGKQLLNITIKNDIYIAELVYKNGMLSILPLSEHFTARMIKSNAELRLCVELHYKTRVLPLYDDDFCLRQMVKVN